MRKFLLSTSVVAASLLLSSYAWAVPAVGDQTFAGRVALSRPSISTGATGAVPGAKLANLAFSGTIQEQATVAQIVDVAPPNAIEGFIGTLAKAQRVSNATVLNQMKELLPGGSIKGWSLRVVMFYNKLTVIEAYKKGQAPIPVPGNLLYVSYGWPQFFSGIFSSSGLNGSASATVSETASGTSVVLTGRSKINGFNSMDGQYFPDYPGGGAIDFLGTGAFTETSKGYSSSINVIGEGPFN
jgi:hypothetical protein